jgi:hypothetical protein
MEHGVFEHTALAFCPLSVWAFEWAAWLQSFLGLSINFFLIFFFFRFITPYHPTKSLSTLICFRVREKPERP